MLTILGGGQMTPKFEIFENPFENAFRGEMHSHFVAKCGTIGHWEVTKSHLVSVTKKSGFAGVIRARNFACGRAIATNFPLRSRIFTGARLPNLARIS